MLATIPEKDVEKHAWQDRIGEIWLLVADVIRRMMAGKLDFYEVLAQLKIWAGRSNDRVKNLSVPNSVVEYSSDDVTLGAMLASRGCFLGEEAAEFKSLFSNIARCPEAKIGLARAADICEIEQSVTATQIIDGIEREGFLTCDFNEGVHFALKAIDTKELFNEWISIIVDYDPHTGDTVVIQAVNRNRGFFLNVRRHKKDGIKVSPDNLVAYKIP